MKVIRALQHKLYENVFKINVSASADHYLHYILLLRDTLHRNLWLRNAIHHTYCCHLYGTYRCLEQNMNGPRYISCFCTEISRCARFSEIFHDALVDCSHKLISETTSIILNVWLASLNGSSAFCIVKQNVTGTKALRLSNHLGNMGKAR